MKARWSAGNRARLLENGEEFFPAVFDAMRGARREIIVETFILFEDKVGMELQQVLLEAAGRGVRVDVLIDGFGCCDLSSRFVDPLAAAGVRIRTFDPATRWFGLRVAVLRRMHRKIVVVDAERAFVGGINYSADHLADFGAQAKQDYAVELSGPVVEEIHRFAAADAAGRAPPRRGVEVRLILQGEPDMPIVKTAASLLYEHLLRDGVHIHEYCKRPLHGKVALVDNEWATVGSSNLDPLSLALNLEANVVLRDRAFVQDLADKLQRLIEQECREIAPSAPAGWGWWLRLRSMLVFHVLRRFPAWAASLPRHAPTLEVKPAPAEGVHAR